MTDASDLGSVTLEPHPYELEKAVAGDHVVVFGYDRHDVQFEISGETDADELNLSWSKVELDEGEVADVLEGGVYSDWGEDPAGRSYTVEVRAGVRHPKGTPVWTRGDESDSDGLIGFCRVCGTNFEELPEDGYERKVSRHIWHRHDDAEPDKALVLTVHDGESED